MRSPGSPCPDCGASLTDSSAFVVWCPACEWNLDPAGATPLPEGRWARRRHERLQARGERLFDELLAGESLAPRWTADRVTTVVLAILVHLGTVLVFVSAVALIVWSGPSVVGVVIGGVIALLGLLLRPRLGRLKRGIPALRRESAPAVFALADRIVAVIGGRPPDVVLVDNNMNASWSVVGLRRQRVLTLGWPLVVASPPNGLVALLGHEISHEINGDITHGIVVHSAMRALVEWQLVFFGPRHTTQGIVELPMRVFGWVAASVPRLTLHAMQWRSLRSSQRAEYLADALATAAAGRSASVDILQTLLLGSSVQFALERARFTGSDDAAPFLRRHLETVPDTEKDRLRRIAARRFHRADDTHPPTHHRIKLVESRAPVRAQVTVSREEADGIVREVLRGAEATRQWRLGQRRRLGQPVRPRR